MVFNIKIRKHKFKTIFDLIKAKFILDILLIRAKLKL